MSAPALSNEVVVGCTANELIFTHTATHVELSLSGWRRGLLATSPSGVLSETLQALGEDQGAELLESLRSAGFLRDSWTSVGLEPEWSPWAVPLARAVSKPSALPKREFCVVHSSTEALVLPAGMSDVSSAEALRLFVSGIRPINLRRCYAFGATIGSASVVGDWCRDGRLSEIREQFEGKTSAPVVVSLASGDACAFAQAPGRLHPAQMVVEREIEFDPGLLLQQCGAAVACPDLRFCDVDPDPWAWGHARDSGLARLKAVAEAVERYATGTVPYRRLVRARAKDLDADYLDPRQVVSFTASQMRRHADRRDFSADEQRYWVLGEDEAHRPTYVLADLVYNPFVPPDSNDRRVHCRVSSSGVAYGRDEASAKERALLECVERDAFLRAWYSRVSPPQLDHRCVGEFSRACIRALQKRGWEVSLLCLTGAAPVVAAVGVSERGLLVGCAAGRPLEAAEKALTELSVALTGLPEQTPIRPDQIRKAEDHTMLYRQESVRRSAKFLTASAIRHDASEFSWDGRLDIQGNTYFVRLPTADEVSDHVWRALVPGLIPMTFGYDTEPWGREDVARALDGAASSGIPLYAAEDILLPHPFA